ncbi:MAG: HAD-IIIA family hydrolase, partial [Gammaproteobacteria bacterium]|nr:HAD-IIIA family hydrolase [Gammaproteobacteria bacterium]
MQNILDKAKKIKLVIFDVDGVLTDGSLFVTESGEEIKAFNSRDGHGLKMLQNSGVIVAIITGRTSNIVTHRMNELGIDRVYQGVRNKYPAFVELLEKLSITPAQTAYVGDDVVDLPVMSHV